jgi:hypothetical protein
VCFDSEEGDESDKQRETPVERGGVLRVRYVILWGASARAEANSLFKEI